MSKNTIIAFVLIFVTIQFFTGDFYWEKFRGKQNPLKPKISDTIQKVEYEDKYSNIEKNIFKEGKTIDLFNDSVEVDTSIVTKTMDTIWVETDKLICGIHELGGKIISIRTKEYSYGKYDGNKDFIELIKYPEKGGMNLSLNDKSYDNEYFECDNNNNKIIVGENYEIISFKHNDITKKYIFSNKKYTIDYIVESDNLADVKVLTGWFGGIAESGKITGRKSSYDKKRINISDGSVVEHIIHKSGKTEEKTGYFKWAGMTSKYFLIALIPNKKKDSDIKIISHEISSEKKKREKEMDYEISISRLSDSKEEKYTIFVGPSQLDELKKHDIGLQRVLFRGYGWFFGADKWFPWVCEVVLKLLINLQKAVKDYGVVIILLTILLKLVTYPLTHSSMKSMGKMRDIQPEINKIREKHKSNPQKMNQELMGFYKTKGINPLAGMGGCLPMVVQMPIFISLFMVLRKSIELRGADTFLIPWVKDLSQPEILFHLPFSLPLYGSTVALLPILMAVLMFFQNKATIKDPNQKAMIYMMPVVMLVMFNNFPSGLTLYFVFSTALQLLQQRFLDKNKTVLKNA